ncbi:hypothetical protein DPMN_009345 [Dreissena polymorpha]|uniref:Uncharacterized protein n=1 Tax=Dreissena polymorpha TaxID=45954 RepID=A0A9D4MWR1_DREPO|nr:hypothetical protein DPMN_009345 [Dreissena polymorpha]
MLHRATTGRLNSTVPPLYLIGQQGPCYCLKVQQVDRVQGRGVVVETTCHHHVPVPHTGSVRVAENQLGALCGQLQEIRLIDIYNVLLMNPGLAITNCNYIPSIAMVKINFHS